MRPGGATMREIIAATGRRLKGSNTPCARLRKVAKRGISRSAALRIFLETNIDFAEALIGEVNRARGCEATATFDREAARLDGFVRVG